MNKNTRLWLSATHRTLVYSDIFNYPLTEKELWERLIASSKIDKKKLSSFLVGWEKQKKVFFKDGYYFLPGRGAIIESRRKKERLAAEKIVIAKKTARVLAIIPSVWMVGLSGNLAVNTATLADDIDLVVVSAPKTLWLTRFAVYGLLAVAGRFLGLKVRRPGSSKTKDRLCLNLFLDYSDLKIDFERQSLFTAYQIFFLKPLKNKNRTYQRFWNENCWIAGFLANSYRKKRVFEKKPKLNLSFSFANRLFYYFQRFYMRGKPRGEKISLTQAFFHPDSKESKTMKVYQKKCRNFCSPKLFSS